MQTNYLRDEARNIERNFAQYDIDTSKLSIDLVLCTPEFFHGKKLEATLFLSPVDIPYFDLSVLPNSEKMIKTSMFAEGGHVEATYTREGKYGNSIYMLRTLPKKLQSLVLAHSIAHVFQNNHNPDLMKISTEIYNINQNMYYELVSFIENESIKYSQRRKDFIAFNNLLGLTDGLDKMPFFDFFKNQFPKGMSVENIINLSIQKKKLIKKYPKCTLMNEGFASDCHTLYSPGLASSNKMALPDFYQVGAEIFRKVRIEQPDEWLNLALEPKTDERFIEKSKDLLGSDVEDIAHSIASQSIDDIVRRVDTYQAPLNIREVRVLKNGDRVPIVESNLGSYLYDEEVFWIFASLGFPDIVYEKSDIFTVAIKVKETKFNPFSHSHQMKSFTTKPSDTKTSGVDEAISWLNQNSHR